MKTVTLSFSIPSISEVRAKAKELNTPANRFVAGAAVVTATACVVAPAAVLGAVAGAWAMRKARSLNPNLK